MNDKATQGKKIKENYGNMIHKYIALINIHKQLLKSY